MPTDEAACFRLLADAGVPMIGAEKVDSRTPRCARAALGYPVVMKGVAPHPAAQERSRPGEARP
jgi:hypothetical protein